MNFSVQTLDRSNHAPGPSCDRARPVTGGEHDFVRIVVEMVLDRFEELLGLGLLGVPTACRLALPRPVDRRVCRVPLSEHVPVLRVPGVVECLHSLEIADGSHITPPTSFTPRRGSLTASFCEFVRAID